MNRLLPNLIHNPDCFHYHEFKVLFFVSSKAIKENGKDKVIRIVHGQVWLQRALSQWYGAGGCRSEKWNPEPMATLSTHFVCSGWRHINMLCLLTADSAAERKTNQPLLQKFYWQTKYVKVMLLKCPFRAESSKVLSLSIPREGDWGMGRLSELPKVTQEVSKLTRNSTQDSCLLHHSSNHWTLFPDGSEALDHGGLPATSNSILPV